MESELRSRPAVSQAAFALAVCTACTFVSAALLFLVQPMFAKMALPLLGGSPQVWNVSVVFYQVVLLLGYSYAHAVRRYVPIRVAAIVQVLLVLAAVAFLPIRLPAAWQPPSNGHGIELWFLSLLFVSVGAPFFILSTTSPLVQSWFASTNHEHAENPYFLYGASNIGSLGALIVYPFLIDTTMGLHAQTWVWAIGYAAFVPLLAACAWIAYAGGRTVAVATAPPVATPDRSVAWERVVWIALAFIPSSLMLGVTTHLSNIIAPIPLLWTLPLALYLATFVIVFARKGFRDGVVLRILPYVLLPIALPLALQMRLTLVPYVAINLLLFFVLALVCHSRLASLRPSPVRLTEFYLCLAIGGALGGIFNTFVAPVIFPDLGEYPLAIVLACLVTSRVSMEKGRRAAVLDGVWPAAVAVILTVALMFVDKRVAVGIALVGAFGAYGRPVRFALSVGAIFVICSLVIHPFGNAIAGERNFFGIKWVLNDPKGRYHLLVHSGALHGIESQEPSRLTEPLAYFSRQGPLGDALGVLAPRMHGRTVASVGLGAGATACYADPSERWTFYEIDPQVVAIAQDPRLFSFLHSCAPNAPMVVGDARLALAAQTGVQNAVMILDAYSADQVPTHMLTLQALDIYLANLAPDGVLLFNVSNQYFDLHPVLGNLAAARNLAAYYRDDTNIPEQRSLKTGIFSSRWVAMARDGAYLNGLPHHRHWHRLKPDPRIPLWTDDYSSLIRVLYFLVR